MWYLPHHDVYHRKTLNSIRVVFDCSARYQGETLNDHLLQGPDLSSKLTGVLARFRMERVAFVADVERNVLPSQGKEGGSEFLSLLAVAKNLKNTV